MKPYGKTKRNGARVKRPARLESKQTAVVSAEAEAVTLYPGPRGLLVGKETAGGDSTGH